MSEMVQEKDKMLLQSQAARGQARGGDGQEKAGGGQAKAGDGQAKAGDGQAKAGDAREIAGDGRNAQASPDRILLTMQSRSQNERFSRTVAAAFAARLDPTLEELSDLKTAVSEAVTNAIIHAYDNEEGSIELKLELQGQDIIIEVRDFGVGIADIQKAMEPAYTTRPEWERSGMGFAFMEAFMDELRVDSAPGEGTRIRMKKRIGGT